MLLFGICLPFPIKETTPLRVFFFNVYWGKLYCHLMAASVALVLPLDFAKNVSNQTPSMTVLQRFIKIFI